VIIVNYNGAHLLPACLAGVSDQRGDGPDFATVVVDNGSSDGSLELLARDYPWVRVIASEVNLGFAGGNNLALRQLESPFAVLLNNDAVPQPGWLRQLLAPFDDAGNERLAMTTGKIHFMRRFAPVTLETEPFVPSAADPRELGIVIKSMRVEGADVFEDLVGDAVPWGPETNGKSRWRWTRASGELAIPVPPSCVTVTGNLARDVPLTVQVRAERSKPLRLASGSRDVELAVAKKPSSVDFVIPEATRVVDVLNNAGNIVYYDGYGADRGFREIDAGQFDEPADVFAGCGNGMAMRTEVAKDLGFFDEDFFMYYEDMDLSWRLRSRGWDIRYVPGARLRHEHAATTVIGSPLFLFHGERNRLLMLTKNAPARLAFAELMRFLRAWLSVMIGRSHQAHAARYPVLRDRALATRVVTSYFRLLPRMLRRRRALRRTAVVDFGGFEWWSVKSR
jgi:GT2 family glycosyltransferase